MIYHLIENCLKDCIVLSSVVVEGGRGVGFAVGFGDREAVFVGGKEVPVTSNEEGTVEWVRQGELNVSSHLGGERTDLGGGEFLVMDVPGNRRWVGKRREA